MKKIFFFILILAFQLTKSNLIKAQDSTNNARLRFSLITCDAGADIYTIWGIIACAQYEGKGLFKKKKLPSKMLALALNTIKSASMNLGSSTMQLSS